MADIPSSGHDALRPFALFAIEARMDPEARFVARDPDGITIAQITGDDFNNAYAYYAATDPDSVDALARSGVAISDAYRAWVRGGMKAVEKPVLWPWLWLFFLLGVIAGGQG